MQLKNNNCENLKCNKVFKPRQRFQKNCSDKCSKESYTFRTKEIRAIKAKVYRLKNKKFLNSLTNKWYYKNKHKFLAYKAKRRALIKHAIPKFADLKKIRDIYKNCPKGFHVDHIVPLQGDNVCGLHVEWNLQYLTKHDNLSKSNKLII